MMSRFPKPVHKPKTRGDLGTKVSSERIYVGHVEAKNTATVGFATTNRLGPTFIDSPYFMMGMSVLKYIVKRHFDVNVVNFAQLISTIAPNLFHTQSNVIKSTPRWSHLTFYVRKHNDAASTLEARVNISIGSTSTITTVAQSIGTFFREFVSSRAENTQNTNDTNSWKNGYRLYGYSYTLMDSMGATDGDATTRNVSPIFPIEDMIVSMSIKHVIKIQNVTQGQSWGTTHTEVNHVGADDLARNPIKGKLFHFSDPIAIVRDNADVIGINTDGYLNVGQPTNALGFKYIGWDNNEDGIMFLKGFAGSNDISYLRQIPRPELWQNCVGVSNIYLNPGEVKTHVQTFKFNGFINKFLEGMAIDILNGASYIRNEDNLGFGTMDLFCFEEAQKSDLTDVNAGSVPVNIGYQLNRYVKCNVVKNVKRGSFRIRDFAAGFAVPTEDYTVT